MSEELFAAVKELLPEIERELREEITQQLEEEYHQKLEEHITKTREEAKQELESVFQEIQQQTFQTFQEKLIELEEREKQMMESRATIEKQIREEIESTLRDQYEQEKQSLAQHVLEEFNQQMMGGELEEKLRERIQSEMDQQMRVELEKKEKLLKVNLRKKMEQERKILEEGFEMEWKQKVDNEKRQLEKDRSEIARLRSLENIRLKKLEDEKKQFKLQMREQEQKYQEIVTSLQSQIQQLEQELNQLQRKQQDLQNQITVSQDQSQDIITISNQFRKERNPSFIPDDNFIPVYQHQKMTVEIESGKSVKKNLFQQSPKEKHLEALRPQKPESVKTDVNKYLFGENESKSLIDKDTAKSFIMKYQDELTKLISKQNKENTSSLNEQQIVQPQQNMKYTEALKRKQQKEDPAVETQRPPFEAMFLPNDLDNEKNQVMKRFRKDLVLRLQKDGAVQPKFEASQLYMRTDYLKKYESTTLIIDWLEDPSRLEFTQLLEQLFDMFETVQLSAQERLDFLKYLQFQGTPTTLSPLIPLMQNKLFQLKQWVQALPSGTLSLMKRRDELRNQISRSWSTYSKLKSEFNELQGLGMKLRGVKLKWRGVDIEELLKLDAWEVEYLQREELKNQLLHKIQMKIL